MLYIMVNGVEWSGWHVGKKLSFPDMPGNYTVQADGDELEYIKEFIVNIPYHKTNRVQRWSGDIARFIIECLK